LLLNFNATPDLIELPMGLRIRRMSEKEVTASHGGGTDRYEPLNWGAPGFHQFCIEGDTAAPKVIGGRDPGEVAPANPFKESLDKAMVCLRTFQEGSVGYGFVRCFPLTFCPVSLNWAA